MRTFLFKNLCVEPVKKGDSIKKEENPDKNRKCFIQPFEKWGALLFVPVHPGKNVDYR
jgi:hypothetical protein